MSAYKMSFDNTHLPSLDEGCFELDFQLGASSSFTPDPLTLPQESTLLNDTIDNWEPLGETGLDDPFLSELSIDSLFPQNIWEGDFPSLMTLDPPPLENTQEILPPVKTEAPPPIIIRTKKVKPSNTDYLNSGSTHIPQPQASCLSPTTESSVVPEQSVTLADFIQEDKDSMNLLESLMQCDSSTSSSSDSEYSSVCSPVGSESLDYFEGVPSAKKNRKGRSRTASKEDAYKRKKEQNKQAATRYRQKKKQEEELIMATLAQEETTHKSLRKELNNVKQELHFMKKLMRKALIAKGIMSADMFRPESK